jgi:hypothetical protein
MSNDDLAAFREEMRRRGVYDSGKRVVFRTKRERPATSVDISSMSIKRLAWGFGCAQPDSQLESDLYRALVEKIVVARANR